MWNKQWFKDQPIKKKILYIYIPLVIIPLLVLGYISGFIFSKSIIEETAKNMTDNASLIVTRINTMMDNTENCANITTLGLIQLIEDDPDYGLDSVSSLEMRAKIESELNTVKITFPDIESAVYIDKDLNVFTNDNRIEMNLEKLKESNFIEEIDQGSPENKWLPMQKREFMITDPEDPVLTLAKKVINPRNGKRWGILLLNIQESSISEIYASMGPEDITSNFILDDQGMIISSQNPENVLKQLENEKLKKLILDKQNFSEIERLGWKRTLVTSITMEKEGWRFVSVIPVRGLTSDIDKTRIVVIFLVLMCFLMAIVAASLLSRVIVKPLTGLTGKMDEIKDGNLEVVCEVGSRDEIGKLASGFNLMVMRIKELLNKSMQEQKKLREYELALIQAQIKPHFLYNSLELIYTLCGMAGAKEAQTATKSLADFYRIALSKGQEVISLEEEIKNVRDYLNIQRYRYCDVFDYEIQIPEEIKNSKILKLTLQPLIENSIYHGLKTKGSYGRIEVKGYLEGQSVHVIVRDDGVGMSRERIAEILDDRHAEKLKESFGLRSVDERLRLFFGEQYGLKIESEPGRGTVINITIPYREEGRSYAEDNGCG